MHLHLLNCHGEWTALAIVATNATILWVWARAFFSARAENKDDE